MKHGHVVTRSSSQVEIDCGIARVRIDASGDGTNRVRVEAVASAPALNDDEWTTAYPVALITELLKAKGPAWFLDEIKRDESPTYVQPELELGMLAYSAPEDFKNARILDFGCGLGSSTMILGRLFPNSTIVAVDFVQQFVEIARARSEFWEDRLGKTGTPFANVRFAVSPDSDSLPGGLGLFDAIVLSGVFEHLLPGRGGSGGERATVMSLLWSHLQPEGVMYVNQTPWRWFPWEFHTTRLPLVNYLPANMVLRVLRFSKQVPADASWPELLRMGVRGGSVGEIVGLLRDADQEHVPVVLRPNRLRIKDRVDLWYETRCRGAQRRRWPKRLYRGAAKALAGATGIEAVPSLTLALAKRRRPA